MVNMINDNIVKLRVHITPIGFEIDRVVEPLIDLKADKVWLIIESEVETGDAAYYYQKVIKFLDQHNIAYDEKRCDIRELYEILNVYRGIIEVESGNQIFVNVSTGTKIHAIAGMMACMIFKENHIDISPYYVQPANYVLPKKGQQFTSGYKKSVLLPNYKIERPDPYLIEALKIIKSKKRMSKKELIDLCVDKELIQIEEGSKYPGSAKHSQLNKKIIEPLLNWKFITIEGKRKSGRITVTQDGENILKFLS